MNNLITNSNPALYIIGIFHRISGGNTEVTLNLYPVAFFKVEKNEDEIESIEPVIGGNINVYLYFYVDIRTGFCWDNDGSYYTNWHTAIIDTINMSFYHSNPDIICILDQDAQEVSDEEIHQFTLKRFKSKFIVKILNS